MNINYCKHCLITLIMISFPVYAGNKVVVVPMFDSAPVTSQKVIFVTADSWNGNLGGLAGADAKCNADAVSRGISGSFQALLGTSADFPLRRSAHTDSSYVTESGSPLKSGFHPLFDNTGLENVIATGGAAWTGLNANGAPGAENCSGWTISDANQSGLMGYTDDINNDGWLAAEPLSCDEVLSLYCIEQ